jgi:hypothetical protein
MKQAGIVTDVCHVAWGTAAFGYPHLIKLVRYEHAGRNCDLSSIHGLPCIFGWISPVEPDPRLIRSAADVGMLDALSAARMIGQYGMQDLTGILISRQFPDLVGTCFRAALACKHSYLAEALLTYYVPDNYDKRLVMAHGTSRMLDIIFPRSYHVGEGWIPEAVKNDNLEVIEWLLNARLVELDFVQRAIIDYASPEFGARWMEWKAANCPHNFSKQRALKRYEAAAKYSS